MLKLGFRPPQKHRVVWTRGLRGPSARGRGFLSLSSQFGSFLQPNTVPLFSNPEYRVVFVLFCSETFRVGDDHTPQGVCEPTPCTLVTRRHLRFDPDSARLTPGTVDRLLFVLNSVCFTTETEDNSLPTAHVCSSTSTCTLLPNTLRDNP